MSQCLTERAASDLFPVHLVHRRRLDHDSRRFGSPVHVARKISATATAERCRVAEVTSVCAWLSASAHAPVRVCAHASRSASCRPWHTAHAVAFLLVSEHLDRSAALLALHRQQRAPVDRPRRRACQRHRRHIAATDRRTDAVVRSESILPTVSAPTVGVWHCHCLCHTEGWCAACCMAAGTTGTSLQCAAERDFVTLARPSARAECAAVGPRRRCL